MRLYELPDEPTAIPDALENFVIHHAIARQMGLGVPEAAEPDRNLRTLSRLIEFLVERDDRPLTEHRDATLHLGARRREARRLLMSQPRPNADQARRLLSASARSRQRWWWKFGGAGVCLGA
jgi:hypothetical protein